MSNTGMTPVIARRIARKVFTLQGGVDIENGNIQGAEEERLEQVEAHLRLSVELEHATDRDAKAQIKDRLKQATHMAKVAVRDQNKAERHIKKHDEKMIEFIRELSGNMHLLDDETRDRISLISGGIQNRIDAEQALAIRLREV